MLRSQFWAQPSFIVLFGEGSDSPTPPPGRDKWLRRYELGGVAALIDGRAIRPSGAGFYEAELWERIFALRERLLTYGPRKLVKYRRERNRAYDFPS